MKGKGNSVKAEDNKAFCHENFYRRNCQTGPLKKDRSELCPQCHFRVKFDHELKKHFAFYSEQKALLPPEQFEEFLNKETLKPIEGMRKAVICADNPGEKHTTNWGGCNEVYIGNKEILQLLNEFRIKDHNRNSGVGKTVEFTDREKEVIEHIHKTYKQIGKILHVEERTIKERVKGIRRKTGTKSKADLKRFLENNM